MLRPSIINTPCCTNLSQYFDVTSVPKLQPRRYSFTHPLTLAAAFASLRACAVLLRQGASALVVEPAGRQNVFHCLVVVAFYEPRREESMVAVYRGLCEVGARWCLLLLGALQNARFMAYWFLRSLYQAVAQVKKR